VANAQGIEVKDRSRIPAELVAKLEAATGNLGPDIETSGGSPGEAGH